MAALFPLDDPTPSVARGHRPNLVSVVVPAFNCCSTVTEQLDALDDQDYAGRWEIILVDNASTEGTREVLESWAGRRDNARFVDAIERRGAGYARNVGSRIASGDFLLFCDADDVVHPGWVAAMADGARLGSLLAGVDVALAERWEPVPVGGSQVHKATARRGGFLPFARGGNLGVSARAFWQVGGWDEGWLRGQDVELSWRLQIAGFDLFVVPRAIVAYRRPEGRRALMRHQFEFGRQAPRLRQHFSSQGASAHSFAIVVRDILSVFVRLPNLARGHDRRQRWLVNASGVAGRLVGTIELRWKRPRLRRQQGPSRG